MADKQLYKYLPKLRFPEFKDKGEWETYTLEELFEIRNGYTPSKSNPNFWDGGTIPWFRMEDIRQNGHILSDSIQHITPAAVKGTGLFPAYSIIVATTATIGEHALIIADSLANQRFTFLTKRKSHDKQIDMMFFHQYMFIIDEWCKKNTNSGGLLSVNMPAFKQLVIPLPSIKEQKAISSILSSLDECIASSKMKLEQLKAHKSGLMQKLFPSPGKSYPEMRFPKFKDGRDWEVKKLCDIAEKRMERNRENLPLPVLTNSATEGILNQANYFERDIVTKDNLGNYYIVDKDDFVYNPRISSAAPVGPISRNKTGCGIMSPLYTVFRFRKGNLDFLEQYFKTNCWHLDIKKKANFGARFDRINLTAEDFFNLQVPFPPDSEQTQIATALCSLDSLIQACKEKLEQLYDLKIGLMQQMFPTTTTE